jgi:siroheme synthase-like protein
MSGLPVIIDGRSIAALVVGAGPVGVRRAESLLAAGASVHLVSLTRTPSLERLRGVAGSIRLTLGQYATEMLDGSVNYVVAATHDRAVNGAVAADARVRGILVNVTDNPEIGTCVVPAVHRSGDIIIAVSAGGVPRVATRIRDYVASIVDDRFARAARALLELRRELLHRGDRAEWSAAADELVPADFCQSVQDGAFWTRLAAWD